MLAQALAKESGVTFINLRYSTFEDKMYGETSKSIQALFSLAEKLAPTIIFIDEIDGLLGRRSEVDSTISLKLKVLRAHRKSLPLLTHGPNTSDLCC